MLETEQNKTHKNSEGMGTLCIPEHRKQHQLVVTPSVLCPRLRSQSSHGQEVSEGSASWLKPLTFSHILFQVT